MNVTMIKVVEHLNEAWQKLDLAINAAYDDGYSGLVWALKNQQLNIERQIDLIESKEYGEE